MNNLFKVIVAEDEPLILNHISNKIEQLDSSFTIIAKCTNGFDTLESVKKLKPDVIFTDIRMPVIDGLSLISKIKELKVKTEIIIISSYSEFDYAQCAIRLGVLDYLLKPLKTENLLKTLKNIKFQLQKRNSEDIKELLYNSINGLTINLSSPKIAPINTYIPLEICIGNILYNSPTNNNYYDNIWNSVPINNIINNAFSKEIKIFSFKELYPNRKILLLEFGQNIQLYNKSIFQKILHDLGVFLNGHTLTISTINKTLFIDELFSNYQNIKNTLDKMLILDKSSLLLINDNSNEKLLTSIIDNNLKNKIKSYIKKGKIDAITNIIVEICLKLQNSPQSFVSNELNQLVLLFEEELNYLPKESIRDATFNIHCLISENFFNNTHKISNIFKQLIYSNNTCILSTTELVDKIDNYIQNNFSQDISLVDIADKFSYSPSYITKIFKKHKGITPQRHIILLRINESQRLIKDEPSLTLKEIGELIGYTDPTYFSRIFKKITGKSPASYKSGT